jgi:membrane protein implicated in regulation of membrane protease activity
MAKQRVAPLYQRVFFDRLLLVGVVFLAISYITRGTWLMPFAEAATFVIGVVWSVRAATTNKSVVFRLLATLVLVLIWSLLSLYLGRVHGLV